MTVSAHFAAGALAGSFVSGAFTASLLGLASHVVLDAIPHYDFESVTLEILLGVVILAILIAVDRCTLTICLGGLFGVIPDLENLFWKLGVIRDDQKVFPSHSGIVPHGAQVGRKNLVIQFIFIVVVIVYLIWSK